MNDDASLLDPTLEKQLKGHENSITAVYYSPNNQYIASGSLDKSVLLWDLGSTMRSYRFRGHTEAVMDVTFSPTGKYMASASRDRTVRLWVPNVSGGTGIFKAHSQTVRSVQFNNDGSKILTASDDKIVKLWSSDKYKFISSFVGHTNWVRCARWSNDGSVIASCSDDKSTRLWNPETGEEIHAYKDQKSHGMNLAWHPSGCYIAVGTSQGSVKLYDIRAHNLVQYYSIHNDAVTQVAFHPSGSYILTASKDGIMKVLDLLEGHPIFTLTGHNGGVDAVAFSPTGETFASGGEDKLVNLWKTNFTELASDSKENVMGQNPMSAVSFKQSTASKGKAQGRRVWHLCYHSSKYPVVSFSRLEDVMERSCTRESCVRSPHSKREEPGPHNNSCRLPTAQCVATSAASSIEPRAHINSCRLPTAQCVATSAASSIEPRAHSSFIEFIESPNSSSLSGCPTPTSPFTTMKDLVSKVRATLSSKNPLTAPCQTDNVRSCPERPPAVPCERDSNDVGHSSQIPRASPPKPSTCSVPFILSRTVGCDTFFEGDEDLFGMVKLKHNDVCYTNGTIEWVGRKRTFPLNTGFKTIEEIPDFVKEPSGKKMRKGKTCSDKTYTICGEEIRECDCVDMLPTIYSIVDHLNALHDTVDIVDMRLNTLEDIVTKDK